MILNGMCRAGGKEKCSEGQLCNLADIIIKVWFVSVSCCAR